MFKGAGGTAVSIATTASQPRSDLAGTAGSLCKTLWRKMSAKYWTFISPFWKKKLSMKLNSLSDGAALMEDFHVFAQTVVKNILLLPFF